MPIKERIIEMMSSKEYKPLLKEELAFIFGINRKDEKDFFKILSSLEKEGLIVKNKEDRYILINFSNKILSIKDSGNGIEEEIITKICEPYFTTKHQSFGVGLGLFTVHEFFVRNLNFKIEFKNEEFEYKNKKLKGLNININFN